MRSKRTRDRPRAPRPGPDPEQHPLMDTPDWIVVNGIWTIGCLAWPAMIIVAARGLGAAIGAVADWFLRRGRPKSG